LALVFFGAFDSYPRFVSGYVARIAYSTVRSILNYWCFVAGVLV